MIEINKNTMSFVTEEYRKANLQFGLIMDDPKISLEKKLEKLIELSKLIGQTEADIDINNSKHFNDVILTRWLKISEPELYNAYQNSLLEIA